MSQRGRIKWTKEESAVLIDLVEKNPALWDTRSNRYMDTAKIQFTVRENIFRQT